MTSVRIEGLGKLDRKLKKLVDRVSDPKVVGAALESAALPMKMEAEARAPKRTGELAESVETARPAPREVAVQAKDFKAWWQEMGTVNHPAQPFLLPAFYGNVRKARTIFETIMRQVVNHGV